jgi:hypothetical protein
VLTVAQSTDTFTRWGVIGSGEGGGRITFQFFTRTENPGIDDRILLLNTNRADLRNTINKMQDHLSETFDSDDLQTRNAFQFGDPSGAGNFFPNGQAYAEEDLEDILTRVDEVMAVADAFVFVATLGGGTGNGSIPTLVNHLKNSASLTDRLEDTVQTAIGVWPFYDELAQRHFNAVCGLSRLLMVDDESQAGDQNTDMVLLAANSHLEDVIGEDGLEELVMETHLQRQQQHVDEFEEINMAIISAIDMMIRPSRITEGVIDLADFIENPSWTGSYHFSPAIATGMDNDVYPIQYMFDRASENAYVPMELSTVDAVYAAVYAPERMIERNQITERDVIRALGQWQDAHDLSLHGQSSLVPKRETGSDLDVMLLLGGFDLEPLLEQSWDQFERYATQLQLDEDNSPGEGILTRSRLDRIVENLEDYLEGQEG